nr:response regulator [Lachnospiraceae bacterium]
NPLHIGKTINEIKKFVQSTPHEDALLTIYEAGCNVSSVKKMISKIRAGIDDIKIAAISVLAVADIPPNGLGIRFNLILTESSHVEVVDLPCEPGDEINAGRILRDRLNQIENPRAVELFVCNIELDVRTFLDVASQEYRQMPFFGTLSTRKLPRNITVYANSQNRQLEVTNDIIAKTQFAMGNDLVESGFVAVVFSGEELHVHMKYALGWKPIGRHLNVELADKGGPGETCIARINGKPATDIYKEYLGVDANKYLVSNTCEFPFIIDDNGIDVCLIPFDYDDEGCIYYNRKFEEGCDFRFSFATKPLVLSASDYSNQLITKFEPEALFLVVCGNRFNFLQEHAHYEWDNFKVNNPDLAMMHGINEIAYRDGRGGILNSAHVAVGFKEGENVDEITEDMLEPTEARPITRTGYIPLQERMAVFLNKMTGELVEKVKEAESANDAKSAFLSNMSHEIRTPINAVLGMDEMILRESNEREIIGYAENIRSASTNLLGLVNDILDFSKIESGKMDIIPVEYEFTSVINDLYNVIRQRASDKNLTLKLDVDSTIPSVLFGDEIRVKQVITNILTNAIKYTEEGSVTLSIKKIKDGEVICEECKKDIDSCFVNPLVIKISVKDTGMGIKDEDKDKLGDAFQRMDEKKNRTIEGTGLGLNITSQLLDLMGSELKFESTYGEGSDFYFYLEQGVVRDEPIGDLADRWTRTSAMHKQYKEKFTAPDARILVVDDTKMNLDVIVNLLKSTKLQIDTVESGEECLKKVTENYYDIIFLDHRMPHMDGMECLERMKTLGGHKCPDSPVISLTANAISGAREEYLAAGFKDYITKPIDSAKLEELLIRYLPDEKVVMKEISAASSSEDKTADEEAFNARAFDSETLPKWLLSVDGMDVEAAVKYCGGEDSFLSILKTFYDTINDKVEEIETFYRDKDWENYNIKVHAMKSSARIVGLKEISDMAKALEEASDEPVDVDIINRDTDELLDKIKGLKDCLSQLSSDESLPEIPESLLEDAYESLKEFVSIMDYELTHMIMESVAGYRLPPDDKKRFDELNECLAKLDWEGMSKILE